MDKVDVKGGNAHPLFSEMLNGKNIGWNFEKFLFNKKGELAQSYPSGYDDKIDSDVANLLKEQ